MALARILTPSLSATGPKRSRRSEVFLTSRRPCSVKLLRTTYIGMMPCLRSRTSGGSLDPLRGGVAARRREISLVQLRQPQLVRADVSAQDRQSAQVSL